MTRVRRLSVAGVLVAALTAGPVEPAVAESVPTPYVFSDREDVAFAPADILSVRVHVSQRLVSWQFRLRGALHLDQSPWRGDSASMLRISAQQESFPQEARVEVRPGPNGAVVRTTTGPPDFRSCRAQLDQPDGLRSLRIRMYPPCQELGEPRGRGNPPPFRVRSHIGFRFDRGGDGTVDHMDAAPNVGYTPYVGRS